MTRHQFVHYKIRLPSHRSCSPCLLVLAPSQAETPDETPGTVFSRAYRRLCAPLSLCILDTTLSLSDLVIQFPSSRYRDAPSWSNLSSACPRFEVHRLTLTRWWCAHMVIYWFPHYEYIPSVCWQMPWSERSEKVWRNH